MRDSPKFELSKHIERYVAALSKLYAQDGERLLQEILVNAQVQVEEQRTYDNWNGGTYGHGLFLTGNMLATVLDSIDHVPREQADLLVGAYNESYELRGSFGFNGSRPTTYGLGLVHHLQRWGFTFWTKERDGTIVVSF
jgi:hypothetical protein